MDYKKNGSRKWTEDECNILKKYYPFMSTADINRKYLSGRTPSQILDKATKSLGLKKSKDYVANWSIEQIDYLKNNYKNLNISVEEMSKYIKKRIPAIIARANAMGLIRDKTVAWSAEEIEMLKKYYPTMKTNELIDKYLPEKNYNQIMNFTKKIGLKKSNEFKIKRALKNLEVVNGAYLDDGTYINPSKSGRLYPPRIKINCSFCGKLISRTVSSTKNVKNCFCSRCCMGKWMSENMNGKNNPNFENGDAWTEDMRRLSAKRSIDRLINSDKKYSLTQPQSITNDILDKLGIDYENEYDCKYYLLDNYLLNHNLAIEVHGNFFHCNPLLNLKNNRESRIIGKDKAKHTYIKKFLNFEILYLWELDLNKNPNMCEELIKKYLENNGILNNYHSFNYCLEDGKLLLKDNVVSFHY